MGGVDVGGGGGKGRRSLDSEINMIPMIDLLMVTISFLLITAVWTHMARFEADAQVPGPPRPEEPLEKKDPEKQLHIEMRSPEQFTLVWKQGQTVIDSVPVPRTPGDEEKALGAKVSGKPIKIEFPELATAIEEQWKKSGTHKEPNDKVYDQAILHTDPKTRYFVIVGVLDAINKTTRKMDGRKNDVHVFNVTFSVN